mmetsp:Transcript_11580/g.35686  ORF Transcript_11580/g.35686 Transcript_11580/m.35686 type:complete len:240 (+) Transcript_11580:289-1008(+)
MDGFEGAPVSRLIFAGAGLATLLLPAGVKDALALDLGAVLARGEWWRLVTHHVAFDGLGSAALGMIALFRFKRFERYMGSRKFCVFAMVAPAFSTALLVGGAVLFRRRDEGAPFFKPASGPYALCFGMYWLFYALVPVTRPKLVEILGARLSDKSFMYLIGAQLLAHAGATSAAPAAAGLAAGAFWLSDALRLRDLALPKRLEPLFAPAPRAPATPGAERRGLPARYPRDASRGEDRLR